MKLVPILSLQIDLERKARPMKYPLLCVALVLVLPSPIGFSVEQWSQFRGPNGSGILEAATPPIAFSAEENVRWKTAVPGGVSSPVVWKDHIFMTGLVDEQLVTLAYDAKNGHERWRRSIKPKELEKTHVFSSPAASTPCTDGERVYVYFNSFGVIAYDFDGNEVWQRLLEMQKLQYGSASSLVLIGGDLIIQRDGNAVDSHLLALDPKTGATEWTIPRPLSSGSHSTPMLWSHDGQDELIVHGKGSLTAYDLVTKENNWWVNGWSSVAIATAVVGEGLLFIGHTGYGDPSAPLPPELDWNYLSATYDTNKDGALAFKEIPDDALWQIRPAVSRDTPGNTMKISSLLKYGDSDKNEVVTAEEWAAETESSLSLEFRDRFVAIRPGGQGNATKTNVVWETTSGLNEMPSPLYYRGYVYYVADGGRLSAHRAKTGERVIDREPFGASGQYVGSPIAANGYIYLVSSRGTITVVRPGETLDVVANNKLGEKVYCTPAFAGNALIVRTESHLWSLGE